MDRESNQTENKELSAEADDGKPEDWEEEVMVNQTRGSQRSKDRSNTPVLFWAAVIFILCAFFFLIVQSWNKVSKDDLKKLGSRIDLVEGRLIQMEENQKGATDLQVQLTALVQSIKRLEEANQNLQGQVAQLNEKIHKTAKPAPAAVSRTTKPVAAKPVAAGKRYHVVQKGETLFRIAQKYNKTVEDLRKSNKLTKTQEIFPGQKLLIE